MVAESLSAAKLLLVIVAHAVYAVIVSSIMSSIIALPGKSYVSSYR